MNPISLITLLFASATFAAPTLKGRQNTNPTTNNNSGRQTIQVTNIDWQRSGSTVNGIRFQATVDGANPAESYRCTSDAGSGEAFQATKIDRCAKGSPITFAYNNGTTSTIQVWYSNSLKSYAGEFQATPGNTSPVTLQLNEVERAPTSTPEVTS